MFRSVRTKFLTAFIISVMITLLAAIVVSYSSINSVYENINERITKAEFAQISNDISSILSETEMLIPRSISNINQLTAYRRLSIAELSYAINDVARRAVQLTRDYRQIDSIYLFVLKEWFLAMTPNHTRQFPYPQQGWPSERIINWVRDAGLETSIVGGIKDEDFPLEMDEPSYLMMYKEILSSHGSSVCIVNIRESTIYERYSSFMEDGLRSIRIVDRNGLIVSSADKSEIGEPCAALTDADLAHPGTVNHNNMVTSYMPMEDYNLVIVNTIPASVYTSQLTTVRNYLLVLFLVSMLLISVFFSGWIDRRLKPLSDLRQSMKQAGHGDYTYQLRTEGNDELAELATHFNAMLDDLKDLNEQQKHISAELRERELAALRNEINPHFLYNTLTNIKCMADLDGNVEISRSIVALGGIIAPLYKVKAPTWTLREEVTLLQKYLTIMNIRYGNGILYEEHIPSKLMEQQVMKFILQPIVENSIIHGFAGSCFSGSIALYAEQSASRIRVTVDDSGSGMSEEDIQKANQDLQSGKGSSSVGMMNVSRRIVLMCGPGYGLFLSPSPLGGLRTTILLPESYAAREL